MNDSVLLAYQDRLDRVLNDLLHQTIIPCERLKKAMHYVLFSGGKRIRPLLVYACGELLNVPSKALDWIAAAIECMHTYSLVHDDLPAMDNDDFRRGQPTCHRAFDEATAILVGDSLQAFAIEILTRHLPQTLSYEQTLNIINTIIQAAGPSGMISGQSLDLSALTCSTLSATDLETIHQLKTGRLISSCIDMVIIAAAHANEHENNALRLFARHLGILFQMQDDYLDQYGPIDALGKGRSSDQANHKRTFANLCSPDVLKAKIHHHIDAAKQTLIFFQAPTLEHLVHHIQNRI